MQLSCCHWINLCENSWRQIYGEIHPFSRKLLKEIRGCLYYLVKYKMGKSCRVNILTRLIPTCPPLIFWGSWNMAMPLWGSRYLLCGRSLLCKCPCVQHFPLYWVRLPCWLFCWILFIHVGSGPAGPLNQMPNTFLLIILNYIWNRVFVKLFSIAQYCVCVPVLLISLTMNWIQMCLIVLVSSTLFERFPLDSFVLKNIIYHFTWWLPHCKCDIFLFFFQSNIKFKKW